MSVEYLYSWLFKCQSCGWWIVKSISSPTGLEEDELSGKTFDVKCDVGYCRWTGQLTGRDAAERIESWGDFLAGVFPRESTVIKRGGTGHAPN